MLHELHDDTVSTISEFQATVLILARIEQTMIGSQIKSQVKDNKKLIKVNKTKKGRHSRQVKLNFGKLKPTKENQGKFTSPAGLMLL